MKETAITKNNILVPPVEESGNAESIRQCFRQTQRASQLIRMVKKITELEMSRDDATSSKQIRKAQELAGILERLAQSRFTELAGDFLTGNTIVWGLYGHTLSSSDIVEGIEEKFTSSSITGVTRWRNKNVEVVPTAKTEEPEKQKKEEEQLEETIQENAESIIFSAKVEATGQLKTYDPFLDIPNPDATHWLEELWERPF